MLSVREPPWMYSITMHISEEVANVSRYDTMFECWLMACMAISLVSSTSSDIGATLRATDLLLRVSRAE